MDVASILTGPLLGGLGGAATAIVSRVLDYKDADAKRKHEIARLTLVLQSKAETAALQGEFAAQAAAHAADRSTYGDSWAARWIVDPLRGVIRPTATIALGTLLGWLTLEALAKGPALDAALQREIVTTSLALATGAISYWFGMRGTFRRG